MAVTSGFYNSSGGDRKYSAVQMSQMLDSIIQDGIMQTFGKAFAVQSNGGLNLVVGTGRAWFNSQWVLNDTDFAISALAAEVSNNRIDAVILEFDSSQSVRGVSIKMLKGTPAGSPVQPAMASTDTLHQYPLAFISRAANTTNVASADITSVVGTPSCPYASSKLYEKQTDPGPTISYGTKIPGATFGRDGDVFLLISS